MGRLSAFSSSDLALLMLEPANLLVLDEPTNDLDVDTLRALEEAILNYAGCVVVIGAGGEQVGGG